MTDKKRGKSRDVSQDNGKAEGDILVKHSGIVLNKRRNSYEQMKRKSEKFMNMFSV